MLVRHCERRSRALPMGTALEGEGGGGGGVGRVGEAFDFLPICDTIATY